MLALCADDAINGTPSCLNGWMTNNVARETWGWEGAMYTDCSALSNVHVHFNISDGVHTAAHAVKQGTDLECDTVLSKNLQMAVSQGLVDATDMRKNAARIFLMFMKLGMFDDVKQQPMAKFNDTSEPCQSSPARLPPASSLASLRR